MVCQGCSALSRFPSVSFISVLVAVVCLRLARCYNKKKVGVAVYEYTRIRAKVLQASQWGGIYLCKTSKCMENTEIPDLCVHHPSSKALTKADAVFI